MRGRVYSFANLAKHGIAAESAYLLDPEWLRDARNVVPTDAGSLRTRGGCSLLADLGTQSFYETMAAVQASAGAAIFLIGVDSGNAIKRIDTANGTVTSMTGGVTARGGPIIQATVSGGQGPIYGNSRISPGAAWQWTGSGNAAAWTASAGSIPLGHAMIFHAGRVWVADSAANPSRVHWSSLQDPRDWSSVAPSDSGSVDLDPNDGQTVRALAAIGPYVLAFKDRKTFLIYDTDTGANRRISDSLGVGFNGRRSVAPSPYGVFFLSDAGVCLTDGQSVQVINGAMDTFIKEKVLGTSDLAYGHFHQDHYYLAVGLTGDQDVTNTILDYDVKRKAWWRHGYQEMEGFGTVIHVGPWASSALLASGEPALWAMGNDANLLRAFDPAVQQDAGSDFRWRVEPGWHMFGQPHLQKRVRELRVDQANLDTASDTLPVVEMAFAPSAAREVLGSVEWEVEVAASPTQARYFTPGYGRMIGVRFRHSEARNELFGYSMGIEMRAD